MDNSSCVRMQCFTFFFLLAAHIGPRKQYRGGASHPLDLISTVETCGSGYSIEELSPRCSGGPVGGLLHFSYAWYLKKKEARTTGLSCGLHPFLEAFCGPVSLNPGELRLDGSRRQVFWLANRPWSRLPGHETSGNLALRHRLQRRVHGGLSPLFPWPTNIIYSVSNLYGSQSDPVKGASCCPLVPSG